MPVRIHLLKKIIELPKQPYEKIRSKASYSQPLSYLYSSGIKLRKILRLLWQHQKSDYAPKSFEYQLRKGAILKKINNKTVLPLRRRIHGHEFTLIELQFFERNRVNLDENLVFGFFTSDKSGSLIISFRNES